MTGITLYESVNQVREILDQVDPETGELPAEYGDIMALVKGKAAAVAAYYVQQEVSAQAAEEHAKKILARTARMRKQAEWLKTYLGQNMKAAGIKSIAGEAGLQVRLHLERDKAIEIFDERQIPEEYRSDPPPPKPLPFSKTKIKAAIDSGLEVPGALLVKRDRVEIKA